MTPQKLAVQVAARRRKTITELQGAKREAQAKAGELYQRKQGQTTGAAQRQEERNLLDQNIPSLFPTPPDLADRMVALADIRQDNHVLEPSAGTGNIAAAIRRAGFDCQCIEINWSLAELLRKRGYSVNCADFLKTGGQFDRIVMNPPFENLQDVDHARHAFDLLRPGGRIVVIASESAFFRQTAKAVAFRAWLDGLGAEVERLPAGTFASSRTQVAARLVIIDKP